jgi:hypothetical protein
MEVENELDLSRQTLIIPVEKINNWTIKVFGVGSVGSHFTKILAKTGFKNIEIYDMDIVDKDNIAAQAYDFKHIGMNKVDAMKEIIKEGTGLEIITHHGAIQPETIINPDAMTIYCCFFDSLEGRKMLFDKLKDFPIIWVDARVGNTYMRHYLTNCADKKEVEDYLTTLTDGKGSDLSCGEKCSYFINCQISGLLVANIISFIKGEQYLKIFIGDALNHTTDINVFHKVV